MNTIVTGVPLKAFSPIVVVRGVGGGPAPVEGRPYGRGGEWWCAGASRWMCGEIRTVRSVGLRPAGTGKACRSSLS